MTRAPQMSSFEPVAAAGEPAVLFDAQRDRRLAETYAPCFTLILQLRAVDEYGDPETLRKQVHDLLQRTEREALRAGSSREEVQAAQFALIAFVDETILSSNWTHKEHWLARPLQLELYNRYDAGEEFFVRLEALLAHDTAPDVLEVYYLCMALGFKGRYLLHEQEKLRGLVESTFARLSRTPGLQPGPLSPNGKPEKPAASEMRSRVPAWAIAAAALVIGLIVYLGMSLYLSGAADDTVRAIEAVPRATQAP